MSLLNAMVIRLTWVSSSRTSLDVPDDASWCERPGDWGGSLTNDRRVDGARSRQGCSALRSACVVWWPA
jgi:hypothetical protein